MADVMTNILAADEGQLSQMRSWFFKESIRINEEREALKRDKERLQKENELFEKKVDYLKDELFKLSNEKRALEQERRRIEDLKSQAKSSYNYSSRSGSTVFFRGVNNELALKKRYKDLLKIYHPDNLNGDTDTIQRINEEFRLMKARF